MITDHVFRSFRTERPMRCPVGGCSYMNCFRPIEDHERAVSGKKGGRPPDESKL